MQLSVFHCDALVARGTPEGVRPVVRALQPLERASDLLAFDDETGRQVDFDWREPAAAPRRGRPALGVEAREVTLLPRHWQWLSSRRGRASATLRQLVEEAMRQGRTAKDGQDAAYRFLHAIAGDRPNFDEAVREMYNDNRADYDRLTCDWPKDVREHARRLAWPG